ncbi:MAG: restriction endonuclease subunit S [Ignavibacteria bacterium]
MSIENELPKNWKIVSLTNDLNYIKTGVGAYSGKKKYYSTGSIKDNKITHEGEYSFVEKPSRANRIAIIGDIFQARMKNTDKAVLIKSDLDGQLFSTGFFQIRTDEISVNNKFIFYFLKSLNFTQLKDKLCSGSTQEALNDKGASKIYIPIPPITEQQLIVSKIEQLFSEIDNGKKQFETALQQLKVYRQSLLMWAFEGKLTYKNVKNGELPDGWKWVKIDYFLNDTKKGIKTGPFGTMLKKNEHLKNGIPVLGIENIGNGIFQMPNKIFISKEKAIELKNYKVLENDIIISRSGTVGEICLLPKIMENSIVSTNLIKLSLNQNIIKPKYFVYLFQGGNVRQQVFKLCKGSSRAFLNQTILKTISFPICSLEEQGNIIDEIESKLSINDKIEETITNSLNQSETLRYSILKKAFEGKLV